MLLFFCIMHVRIQDYMHAIWQHDLFSRLYNNYMYILLHTYNEGLSNMADYASNGR